MARRHAAGFPQHRRQDLAERVRLSAEHAEQGLGELGYEQERMARVTGVGFAVRSLAADYLKPARLDDRLAVVSQIEALGRAQITFAQQVERDGERLLGATLRVACVDLGAMKPTAIPSALRELFQALL